MQLFLVTTSSIVFQVKDFSARNGHLEACRNDNLCPICPRPQEGLFNDEPPPAIIIIAHCWPLSAPRQIVPAFPFQPYPGNGRYFDCSNWNIMKEDLHNQDQDRIPEIKSDQRSVQETETITS